MDVMFQNWATKWYMIILFMLVMIFVAPFLAAILCKMLSYIPINGKKLEDMYRSYLNWLGGIFKL